MTEQLIAPAGISIITPNWNHEYLLGRSMHSALRTVQLLRAEGVPAEIIVIDDASRDGSPTLLRQLEALYFEEGLRVRLLGCNGGPVQARNYALHVAKYRHVLTLDADNELFPENIIYFYRSSLATGAAITYGNLIILYDNKPEFITSHQSYQFDIKDNLIDTMCILDRSQIFQVGGYFDNQRRLMGIEDWLLHLHLALSGRLIVFVPMLFGRYYMLDYSVFREFDKEHSQQYRNYLRRVYDQLGIRRSGLLNTRWLRYHPDLGYI